MINFKKYTDKHLRILDDVVTMSKKMIDYAVVGDIDQLSDEISSRDRAINVVGKIQNIIEGAIEEKNRLEDNEFTIISVWNKNFQKYLEAIDECDQVIIGILNQTKVETKNDIIKNFKEKNLVKNYNINNVGF